MKIVVLAGGLSTERDVSLASGAGICKTLRERGHEAFLLDVYLGFPYDSDKLDEVFTLPNAGLEIAEGIKTTEPDLPAIKASREDQSDCFVGPNVIEICRLADIVFMGLHGDVGENGKLQATFDILDIRYTGPNYLGSALAMDKGIAKKIFKMSGVPTPMGTALKKEQKDTPLSTLGLSLPVVVKPCSGGSSIGVYIVNTEAEYTEAIEKSFCYEDEIVIEPYIKGREFAVGILDGKALPVIEIIPKTGFFDYANKYQAGATEEICPAPIDDAIAEKMQRATELAFKSLKLDIYSRADFLLDEKGDIYCLEVNTLPGMTATSLLPQEAKAAGIEYGELCEFIIKKSLERYES